MAKKHIKLNKNAKFWTTLSIVFFVGAFTGIYANKKMDTSNHTTDQDEMSMEHESHHTDHAMIEVDETLPIPTVTLLANPDTKDGYNLIIATENFTFSPESAGIGQTPNQGHVHLMVNGAKLARVYGEWFHLSMDDLTTGENEVEVILNADDHSEWTYQGEHIADSIKITIE